MKKTCAVCKNLIDLNEEGVAVKSIEFPGMYYCMCSECGTINVDCSSNATLIALDQVVSDNIQKDAEKSIEDFLRKRMDFNEFLDMLCRSASRALESLAEDNEKKQGEKDTKDESFGPIKVVKISAEPSKKNNKEAFDEAMKKCEIKKKESKAKKIVQKRPINESKHMENTKDSSNIKYISYSKGVILKDFKENMDIKAIFNELIDKHGIKAVMNEEVVLYEMKPVKPNFKEKITYELDM